MDLMHMARGSVARFQDGKGIVLHVREGALWITQERDARDHYVKAGESFRLDRDGTALASALRPTSFAALYEFSP